MSMLGADLLPGWLGHWQRRIALLIVVLVLAAGLAVWLYARANRSTEIIMENGESFDVAYGDELQDVLARLEASGGYYEWPYTPEYSHINERFGTFDPARFVYIGPPAGERPRYGMALYFDENGRQRGAVGWGGTWVDRPPKKNGLVPPSDQPGQY